MPVTLTGGDNVSAVQKIMALVHGFPGTGKTEFGFSFPPPFYVYNLDRPIDSVVRKLPKTHEIFYEHVPDDVDNTSMAVAAKHLATLDALVKDAMAQETGTFIVDGFDLLWDLVKIAKIPGGQEEAMPREWSSANEYMNSKLRRLHMSPLNVVLTTMSSKIWTGAKTETERVKADGFKHRDRWLTHEIYMFTPENTREPFIAPKQATSLGLTHQAYIGQSKLNEGLVGRVLPSLTFPLLYKLTFGTAYPGADKLWSPAKAAAPVAVEAVGATT